MKKTVIILLALFLALPAVSFAGSATSRWDMTIGGYVKFDMGWGSQSQGQDAFLAARQGFGSFDNAVDQNGNFYMYAGETRLNFLMKGPDAWGAKTSAFIEGHFRGDSVSGTGTSTTGSQGTFSLRHAFMQFDWPTTKLIIGQTWQKWGLLPTFANTLLEYNGLGPFLKGSRQPLVRVEKQLTKNWNFAIGAISPTNTLGNADSTGTGVVNSYGQSQMPFFEGSFGWTSDKCGNIGPWQMLFNIEGFYGRQKMIYGVGSSATGTFLINSDKEVDAWGIALKGFIPIIPEKKGDKKNALSLSGVIFYAQNPGWFQGPVTTSTYSYQNLWGTNAGLDPAFHTPTTYGGWAQASYWFTDKLYINGWFGYTRNNLSNFYGNGTLGLPGVGTTPGTGLVGAVNANAVQNTTQMILNLSYDVNAAIRFGLEGAVFNTRYAGYTFSAVPRSDQTPLLLPTTQKDGTYYTVRVGAFYFF